MSLDIETIIDRRRLKRRLSLWRLAALVALGAAILILLPSTQFGPTGDHVARVTLSGLIIDDRAQQDLIREIGESDNAKALLLYIDSPGGTTTGSEALYETVRKVAETKPVVAVLGTVAASGGYIAALSADHIVSRGNTITGSIGVFFQLTQVTGLMETIGVDVDYVRSAPLKAQPNMFEDPPREALRSTQEMVDASYNWFIGLVVDRRSLDEQAARKLSDGRVYTGWQAMENGLVDAIGGEEAARAWLFDEHDVANDLPTEDWTVDEETDFSSLAGQALVRMVALAASEIGEKTLSTKGLTLDGLVSVWHPESR
ncbi:MAG: signal peptide peptidase SppA [Parvibaculaceae bacterium]